MLFRLFRKTVSLFLIVVLFVSSVPAISFASAGVVITSPTVSAPSYNKEGDSVVVRFLYGSTGPANVRVKVFNGANIIGDVIYNGLSAGQNEPCEALVPLNMGLQTENWYDVQVTLTDTSDSSTVEDTEYNAIILDNTAPVVNATSPVSVARYRQGTVVSGIDFTFTELNPVSYSIEVKDNVSETSIGFKSINNPASVTSPKVGESIILNNPAADGTYDIIITVMDKANNEGSFILEDRVIVDNIPPDLNVNPTDELTKYISLNVTGTVEQGASVSVNGQLATVTGTDFSKTHTLTEGANTVTVVATDAAGNQSTITRNVELDTLLPVLAVDPTPPSAEDVSLTVSGTVTDANMDRVFVNGVEASLSGSSFSATLKLAKGENTVTVTAIDLAGNEAVPVVRTVNYIGPVLNVDDTLPFIPTSTLELTGDTYGAVLTRVTLNGQEVGSFFGDNFTQILNLVEGPNTIIIEAFDSEGQSNKDERTVVYDGTNPSLNLDIFPGTTNLTSFPVTGQVEDANPGSVTVNIKDQMGQVISTSTTDKFTPHETLPDTWIFTVNATLPVGFVNIEVIAVDKAGNSGDESDDDSMWITVDTEVALELTELPTFISGNSIPVSGMAESSFSTVKVNDTPVVVTSRTFNTEIPLPEPVTDGHYPVRIWSNDEAGNIYDQKFTVIRDTIAPVLYVTVPTNTNKKVLTGRIVDANISVIDRFGETLPSKVTFKINNGLEIEKEVTAANFSINADINFVPGPNKIVITVVDPAGNESIESTRTIFYDGVKPSLKSFKLPAVSSSTSKNGTFRVTWAATDSSPSSGILYDVQYKTTGGWVNWLTNATRGYGDFPGKPGNTYYFRINAKDRAGNGAWTTATYRTIVPYDNDSLIISRKGFGSKAYNANYYYGSTRYSTVANNYITYRFSGKSLSLLATYGKGQSKAKVYVDGKLIKTVDTYSRTTKFRQLIPVKSWSAAGTHTVKIVNLATKGRKRLDIDGIAVGR